MGVVLFCCGDNFEEDLSWEPKPGFFLDLVELGDVANGVRVALLMTVEALRGAFFFSTSVELTTKGAGGGGAGGEMIDSDTSLPSILTPKHFFAVSEICFERSDSACTCFSVCLRSLMLDPVYSVFPCGGHWGIPPMTTLFPSYDDFVPLHDSLVLPQKFPENNSLLCLTNSLLLKIPPLANHWKTLVYQFWIFLSFAGWTWNDEEKLRRPAKNAEWSPLWNERQIDFTKGPNRCT